MYFLEKTDFDNYQLFESHDFVLQLQAQE